MEYASSIQAVAVRVTKLGTNAAPLVGARNSFVTSQFTRVSFTPNYEAGEEISEKGADGSVCVYFKSPDVLKNVSLQIAICNPQPELYEMLADGSLLTGANGTTVNVTNKEITSDVATLTTDAAHGLAVGDTVVVSGVDATFDGTYTVTAVGSTTTFSYNLTAADVAATAATGTAAKQGTNEGWASPVVGDSPNVNGLGLEVWSRRIIGGRPAASAPYWRWVFPSVNLRMDGERALENGAMAHAFSGDGVGNAAFGKGPINDWTYPQASVSPMAYAADTAAPTGINNYAAVLAQA